MIGSFCFYISNKHFNLTIMKKIFLSLAFLFGIGMSVMADNTMQIKNDTIAVEDGFKTIDLKEVPQSIKDAIAKKAPGSTLKSASLSLKQEGVKSYRVVYVTKEGVPVGGINGSVVILGGLIFVNFPLCIHLC